MLEKLAIGDKGLRKTEQLWANEFNSYWNGLPSLCGHEFTQGLILAIRVTGMGFDFLAAQSGILILNSLQKLCDCKAESGTGITRQSGHPLTLEGADHILGEVGPLRLSPKR